MAWEWSHTEEAYRNVSDNVHNLPREDLLIIMGEWQAYKKSGEHPNVKDFNLKPSVAELPNDILADTIYAKAEEKRTCENGGGRAWVCPYGCHTVPFDYDGSDDEIRNSDDA